MDWWGHGGGTDPRGGAAGLWERKHQAPSPPSSLPHPLPLQSTR